MRWRRPRSGKHSPIPCGCEILKLLAGKAHTNEELAAVLGEKSGKLYFHTKRLLDAGLIILESTRQKGPNTEKFYRAIARKFIAPIPVSDGVTPRLERMLRLALELYRRAWQESSGLTQQTEFGFHLVLPLDPLRRAEFVARLQALRDDFKASGSTADGAHPVVLTVLMHTLDRADSADSSQ